MRFSFRSREPFENLKGAESLQPRLSPICAYAEITNLLTPPLVIVFLSVFYFYDPLFICLTTFSFCWAKNLD